MNMSKQVAGDVLVQNDAKE